MKKHMIVFLFLLSIPLFSQTKILIYKIDGSVDSVLLSQIKNITFSTTSNPVTSEGLVAYYPLDGNAADSSGNGYSGTVFYATPTQDRFGVDSGAYSFNGTGTAIEFGNILNDVFCAPVAKFSVSGWALVKSGGPASNYIIGKNAGGTSGPYQWNVSYYYGYVQAAVFSDTLAQNFILVQSPVSLNQWFHFVMVFDGSLPQLQRVKLFVNGSSGSTSIVQNRGSLGTTTIPCQQTLSIGATRIPNTISWSDFFNGNVDDIRIYNRALNATEVLDLYLSNN